MYELHGSVHRNRCLACGKKFSAEAIARSEGVPRCDCGGLIKPNVVLYGEPLEEETVQGALAAISACDTLIVAGTSLTVYPAAGFVEYFRGSRLVLINRDQTALDKKCDLVIHGSVGKAFAELT